MYLVASVCPSTLSWLSRATTFLRVVLLPGQVPSVYVVIITTICRWIDNNEVDVTPNIMSQISTLWSAHDCGCRFWPAGGNKSYCTAWKSVLSSRMKWDEKLKIRIEIHRPSACLKYSLCKATHNWLIGPHVCLKAFWKSRGDGKIKKKILKCLLRGPAGLAKINFILLSRNCVGTPNQQWVALHKTSNKYLWYFTQSWRKDTHTSFK